MKKIIYSFLTIALSFLLSFSTPLTLCAATSHARIVSEIIEYYEDGSYLSIFVTDTSPIATRSSEFTKSGSKAYVLSNKDGVELWRFTVHGTFSVNAGVSVTCTSASHSISISESSWQNVSASSYRSNHQAIGDATFKKVLLFITTETKNCNVVLSCDVNGTLS